jgi:hypothetical protein
MELDNGPTPDEWVSVLIGDARESAKATVDGIDRQAGHIADAGSLVAKLADVVTRMAKTVDKTRQSATATKNAVTAVDWFWRQCKLVITAHRKLIAGGACLAVGIGGHSEKRVFTTEKIPAVAVAQACEDELHQWGSSPDSEFHWHMAQVRHDQGDELTAGIHLRLAAKCGHATAAAVIRNRDTE